MKEKTELMNLNNADCCGCGTCALVCSKNAITMVPKELGSIYPEVNQTLCIGCGLCEKICAYRQRHIEHSKRPLCSFAAVTTDKKELEKSASGGVSAAISTAFIKAGGIVAGCSLEAEKGTLQPRHILVHNLLDLGKLQGSKYVQSSMGSVFEKIKGYLDEGRRVLFTGTPCQVDSLRYFLRGVNTENLFTIDLICHGVPSTELFDGYLKTLKGQVEAFSFRDKTFGWGLTASYTCRNNNGRIKKYLVSPNVSSYYTYFLEGETYRESCYSCKYADADRVGDITIGDFWGIEQEHPQYLTENGGELCVRNGISALLVNTEKGQQLINEYGSELLLKESEFCKVSKWNRQLTRPSSKSPKRDDLVRAYSVKGYTGIEAFFRKQLGLRLPVRKMKEIIKLAIQKTDTNNF